MGQGGRSSWERTPILLHRGRPMKDFVSARASSASVTGEPVFKSIKLVDVHDKLMRSLGYYPHGEGIQPLFYLDSLKNRPERDYSVLSKILDDGGGRVRFKHYKDVSCTQQQDRVSCGYHLCYHTDIFVRSEKSLNKGVEIPLFGTHLESNPFDRKKEFTRIQGIFAKIINTEVALKSRVFYGGDDYGGS